MKTLLYNKFRSDCITSEMTEIDTLLSRYFTSFYQVNIIMINKYGFLQFITYEDMFRYNLLTIHSNYKLYYINDKKLELIIDNNDHFYIFSLNHIGSNVYKFLMKAKILKISFSWKIINCILSLSIFHKKLPINKEEINHLKLELKKWKYLK